MTPLGKALALVDARAVVVSGSKRIPPDERVPLAAPLPGEAAPSHADFPAEPTDDYLENSRPRKPIQVPIDPLNRIELQILKAVEVLERHSGKVSTQAIAIYIGLSPSQTWRYLKRLEGLGLVRRVGLRGGWKKTQAGKHL